MSEHEEKKADDAPKKKGALGLIIGLVLGALVLVGGTAAAVLMLVPGVRGTPAAEGEAAEEEHAKPAEDHGKKDKPAKKESGGHEKKESGGHGKKASSEHGGGGDVVPVDLPSIVVDLRDRENRLRHLKVGLSAELSESGSPDSFKPRIPRAREAALTYLRSLSFDTVSDPTQYATIKQELANRVIEAVGEDQVDRVLIVDFVSQ
jgi:flagellar basal body-associated protein FliL